MNAEAQVPFVWNSDTSRNAAKSIREGAAKLRERVRVAIARREHYGATCDELESLLEMRHQTCSARVHELAKVGAIVDSGERRKTRSGRKAAVYRAA